MFRITDHPDMTSAVYRGYYAIKIKQTLTTNKSKYFHMITVLSPFWLSLPIRSGSLKRIKYSKLYSLAHTLLLIVFYALKGTHFYILFVVTAAGVVLCGGPKKQPRTSSIVQFIFFFWSFEIRGNTLRYQKILIV